MSFTSVIRLKECLLHLGRGQAPTYCEEESNVYAVNQKCVRKGTIFKKYARAHDPRKKVKENSILQDGDVCINSTGTGTIGRVGLWGQKHECSDNYFADSHVTIARPDKEIVNPKFLSSVLQSERCQAEIESHCFSGSTNQVELSRTALGNLEIFLLEKQSQDVVADILNIVDKAIEQAETIIAKQQRIKTGLMQDLLTKGIDEHGNMRSEKTHEFKDSPLGRMPVEWEVATVSSKLLVPPKNGYSPVEVDTWTGIGMLGLGCLTKDGFVLSQVKNAPGADRKTHKAMLNDGDFLISRSNTRDLVGLVGIFSSPGYPCIYPDLMVRLHFNADVSNEYMQHAFQCGVVRHQLQKNATGTSESMVKISAKIIKNVIFQCPSVSEQSRINDVIFAQQKKTREAMAIHGKLLSIRTGLMHDLLTGTVPVTNLLDEASPT